MPGVSNHVQLVARVKSFHTAIPGLNPMVCYQVDIALKKAVSVQ